MIRRFARPYAKAIMEVAETAERAATLRDELSKFAEALAMSADLRAAFENPAIDSPRKAGIVKAISERIEISELSVRILDVLVSNDRINNLREVVEALVEMIHDATNTVVAEVRSAHELSEEERATLESAFSDRLGRNVELDVSTDASLLGGFVATVGSEVWDASVVAKINKIRERLT